MALIVEDGTGLATAESYCSVAVADAYFLALLGASSTWATSATDLKERSLRLGTQYLDALYGARWIGTRLSRTQALNWPRWDAWDIDSLLIASTTIPIELIHATAEAALRSITETSGLVPDISDPGAILKEAVKIGPIEESKEYAGGRPQWKQFRKVELLLSRLLRSGLRMELA